MIKTLKIRLLCFAAGIKLFHDFLKSEYAEENLLFWLAVEKLKKETEPSNIKNLAQMIYNDYVSTESPKEVRREKIHIANPKIRFVSNCQ